MGKTSDLEKVSVTSFSDNSITDEGVDRAYEIKCNMINKCLQEEIGFGRYQIQLFILSGFGWLADNFWLQGVAVVLPQVQQEFLPSHIEFGTLSLFAGLIVGASTWGVLADVIGRRLSFNITLFLAGVFGIAAGAAPNFVAFGALVACTGFGIGGNLPVDGALYLEAIPQSHQWTLTLLSAWWAVGQLIASVVAWGFIGNFSCAADAVVCNKGDNMGWRYVFYTLGGMTFLMFVMRFIIFDVQESPKYLVAKGRDAEAMQVLESWAKKNGRTITLTLEKLQTAPGNSSAPPPQNIFFVLRRIFSNVSLSHIKPLFAHKKLAINSTITILLWGLIGLAYPLFNGFLPLYLQARVSQDGSVAATYRNYTIVSVCGIPGSIIACVIVDWTRNGSGMWTIGGRKMAMAVSTALTGLFLFLFTTSKTEAAILGFSCASGLTQNAMYGVLYAYTPEVFPGPHRGTADAICSAVNRIFGILAPVIKLSTVTAGTASGAANAPIFVSATLFVVSALLMLLLPIETAGKAAL